MTRQPRRIAGPSVPPPARCPHFPRRLPPRLRTPAAPPRRVWAVPVGW